MTKLYALFSEKDFNYTVYSNEINTTKEACLIEFSVFIYNLNMFFLGI